MFRILNDEPQSNKHSIAYTHLTNKKLLAQAIKVFSIHFVVLRFVVSDIFADNQEDYTGNHSSCKQIENKYHDKFRYPNFRQ